MIKFPRSYFDIYFDAIEAKPWLRDAIISHYSEPHRHYHTMEHIGLMLNHLDLTEFKKEKIYAAFMHDVIYDVRRADNEYQSAKLAESWAYMTNLNDDEIMLAIKMILATDGHAYNDDSKAIDDFIQADLSIFNEPFSIYTWYVDAIRKEYAHISKFDYCQGRTRILEKFLELDYINKNNIEWELDRLVMWIC